MEPERSENQGIELQKIEQSHAVIRSEGDSQSMSSSCLSKQQSSETEGNSSDNSSEIDYQSEIQVIGGRTASQQLLLIKGVPGQIFQFNGKIIQSSKPIGNGIGDNLMEFMNQGFKKIEQKEIGYYIVSKRPPFTGKILILDTEIYGEKFYVDRDCLLLINLDQSQYKIERHSMLSHLKMYKPENPQLNVLHVIQGKSENPIIEKTLAFDEQMYLPNGHVVAMSNTVTLKKVKKTNEIKFKGPGIIFFEPKSIPRIHPKLRLLVMENIAMILFLALILLIEVYFLGMG